MDKEKLEELVNEAKTGNKEAFSELIKYVQHDLYNIAKSRLPNLADAQDILQITITAAYLNISKLKKPKLFKAWIIRILINACNKFYNSPKMKREVTDDLTDIPEETNFMESDINFADMIKDLPETEQEILTLRYKEDKTIKFISKKLNINENTVKTKISRSLEKLRKKYSIPTICMFILCFLVATTALAVSIISYIQSLFSTSNVGIENPGVLMAIEHKDWFQEVDMDYIDLGDGYKIKVEYLLMDEMSLYLVFDFVSETEDISGYTDIGFPDIKITNENNETVCNEMHPEFNQNKQKLISTTISSSAHSIKELLVIYTDSFPICNTLNINFSKIHIGSISSTDKITINSTTNLSIDLLDKFVNRHYYTYSTNNANIEKAIITETGFYAIVNSNIDSKNLNAKLIDENGNKFNCYPINLSYNSNSNSFQKLITCPLDNIQNSKLTLIIRNKKYELIKKE